MYRRVVFNLNSNSWHTIVQSVKDLLWCGYNYVAEVCEVTSEVMRGVSDDSKHLCSDKWSERGGVSHKPKTQLKGGQCESGRQAGRDRAQAIPRQTKTRDRFGRPRPVAREQEGALHYTTLQGEYSSMDDPAESHSEMIRSVAWSEFLFSLDFSHTFSAKCDDRLLWVLSWVCLLDRLMVSVCLLRFKMVALDNVDCMYQYNLDRTVVLLSTRGAWWLRSRSHGWNSLIQIVWIHYASR